MLLSSAGSASERSLREHRSQPQSAAETLARRQLLAHVVLDPAQLLSQLASLVLGHRERRVAGPRGAPGERLRVDAERAVDALGQLLERVLGPHLHALVAD